jgi:DNA topoisomerase-1
MICSQEYTKPPLRYNEANIIKQLEKQGIGRPSTYASILSKIIQRKYVEIKNIEGVEKESLTLTLDKKYKSNEKIKTLKIGTEKNKMAPTELGIKVNEFLENNFEELMEYKFTAKMEQNLDKIAAGKKVWYDVLAGFQKTIEPQLEKLKDMPGNSSGSLEQEVGEHTNGNIICKGSGKHGPYVVLIDRSTNTKKYASLKEEEGNTLDNITITTAIKLLNYPKILGKIDKDEVILKKGQYGFYCSIGKDNVQIKDIEPEKVTIDYVKSLLLNKITGGNVIKVKVKSSVVDLKEGPYGLYFQWTKGGKVERKTFPSKWNKNKLELDKVEFYLFGSSKNK